MVLCIMLLGIGCTVPQDTHQEVFAATLSKYEFWPNKGTSEIAALKGKAVPALRSLLSDGNPRIVLQAIFIIGEIGEDSASEVEPLSRLLSHSDAHLKASAITALGKLSKFSTVAATTIIELFKAGDLRTKRAVVTAMRFGSISQGGVSEFMKECLRNPQAEIRQDAEISSFLLGTSASDKASVALSVEVLTGVRSATPKEAVSSIRKRVSEGCSLEEIGRCALALGLLGRDDVHSANILEELLVHTNASVRAKAVLAVSAIRDVPERIQSAVTGMLKDGSVEVRLAGIVTVSSMAIKDDNVVRELIDVAGDDRQELTVRIAAVEAIGNVAKNTADVSAKLKAIADDTDELLINHAIKRVIERLAER